MPSEHTEIEPAAPRPAMALAIVMALSLALLMLYMPFQFQATLVRYLYPFLRAAGSAYAVAGIFMLLDAFGVGMPRVWGTVGRLIFVTTLAAQAYAVAILRQAPAAGAFYAAFLLLFIGSWVAPHLEAALFVSFHVVVPLGWGLSMLVWPDLYPTAAIGPLSPWLGWLFLLTGAALLTAVALRSRWRAGIPVALMVGGLPWLGFGLAWVPHAQWLGMVNHGTAGLVAIIWGAYRLHPWKLPVAGLRKRMLALTATLTVVPLVCMGTFTSYAVQSLDRREALEALRIDALQVEAGLDSLLRHMTGEPADLDLLNGAARAVLPDRSVQVRVLPLEQMPEDWSDAGRYVGALEHIGPTGERELVAFIRREGLPARLAVGIIVSQPAAAAYDESIRLARISLALTVLFTAVATLLSLPLTLRLTARLASVREAAASLGKRHFQTRMQLPEVADDEVGDLALAMNQMAAELEAYSAEQQRLMSVTDAALAHLRGEDLSRELLARVQEALQADSASLLLTTEDGQHIRLRASHGPDPLERTTLVPVGHGFAGTIAATGEPLVVEDLPAVKERYPNMVTRDISLAGVPLMVGGRVAGVLRIGSRTRRQFGEEELRFLRLVADRIALAVENAELFAAEVRARHEVEEQRAEIQRLNEDLERRVTERTGELTAANQELATFAYTVSHDLRGPLRNIDGYSHALLEDYSDRLDEDGREYLKRIRTGIRRTGQMIDALLQLSRVTRSELRRTRVNLSHIAQTVATDLYGLEAERSAQFVLREGVTVRGDDRLLTVLMENLLRNAWKFTRDKTPAIIEFGVLTTLDDGRPVYFVRDNGAGFDMAYAGKLFEPFQRLHPGSEFEGTGVGLATAQRIVARHGGRIWAEGAVGKGATFYFTLGQGGGAA